MLPIAVVSVTAVTTALLSSPAYAADSTLMGTYQNKQTGLCLDANTQGRVYTSPCDSTKKNPYQQWVFTYKAGSNTGSIRQVATGKCLWGLWETLITAECTPVNPSANEWVKDGDRRRNAADPGSCLDSNHNYEAYLLKCNGGGYQNWQLNVIARG